MAPRVLLLSVLSTSLAACSSPQAEVVPGAVGDGPVPAAVGLVSSVEPFRLAQALNAQGIAELDDRGRILRVRMLECSDAASDECVGAGEVSWTAATFAPAGSVELPSFYWSSEDTFFAGPLREGHGATGYSIISSDVDGDGIDELLFRTGRDGGYGGPSYTTLRWQGDRNAWVEAPELSELTVGSTGVFSIDAGGVASVWFADGCCVRIGERYAIRGGLPQLLERRTETLVEGEDDEVQVKIESFEAGNLVRSTTESKVTEDAK